MPVKLAYIASGTTWSLELTKDEDNLRDRDFLGRKLLISVTISIHVLTREKDGYF